MDPKDKAIRFLVVMLKEIVSSYDNKQSASEDVLASAERTLNEKLSAARVFLNQISKSTTLNEINPIGESLNVQVTRGSDLS